MLKKKLNEHIFIVFYKYEYMSELLLYLIV